ncbi:hypothetical protein BVX93_01130, partial [bacterium B13(2017)]
YKIDGETLTWERNSKIEIDEDGNRFLKSFVETNYLEYDFTGKNATLVATMEYDVLEGAGHGFLGDPEYLDVRNEDLPDGMEPVSVDMDAFVLKGGSIRIQSNFNLKGKPQDITEYRYHMDYPLNDAGIYDFTAPGTRIYISKEVKNVVYDIQGNAIKETSLHIRLHLNEGEDSQDYLNSYREVQEKVTHKVMGYDPRGFAISIKTYYQEIIDPDSILLGSKVNLSATRRIWGALEKRDRFNHQGTAKHVLIENFEIVGDEEVYTHGTEIFNILDARTRSKIIESRKIIFDYEEDTSVRIDRGMNVTIVLEWDPSGKHQAVTEERRYIYKDLDDEGSQFDIEVDGRDWKMLDGKIIDREGFNLFGIPMQTQISYYTLENDNIIFTDETISRNIFDSLGQVIASWTIAYDLSLQEGADPSQLNSYLKGVVKTLELTESVLDDLGNAVLRRNINLEAIDENPTSIEDIIAELSLIDESHFDYVGSNLLRTTGNIIYSSPYDFRGRSYVTKTYNTIWENGVEYIRSTTIKIKEFHPRGYEMNVKVLNSVMNTQVGDEIIRENLEVQNWKDLNLEIPAGGQEEYKNVEYIQNYDFDAWGFVGRKESTYYEITNSNALLSGSDADLNINMNYARAMYGMIQINHNYTGRGVARNVETYSYAFNYGATPPVKEFYKLVITDVVTQDGITILEETNETYSLKEGSSNETEVLSEINYEIDRLIKVTISNNRTYSLSGKNLLEEEQVTYILDEDNDGMDENGDFNESEFIMTQRIITRGDFNVYGLPSWILETLVDEDGNMIEGTLTQKEYSYGYEIKSTISKFNSEGEILSVTVHENTLNLLGEFIIRDTSTFKPPTEESIISIPENYTGQEIDYTGYYPIPLINPMSLYQT